MLDKVKRLVSSIYLLTCSRIAKFASSGSVELSKRRRLREGFW